jgi:hypothetical protein
MLKSNFVQKIIKIYQYLTEILTIEVFVKSQFIKINFLRDFNKQILCKIKYIMCEVVNNKKVFLYWVIKWLFEFLEFLVVPAHVREYWSSWFFPRVVYITKLVHYIQIHTMTTSVQGTSKNQAKMTPDFQWLVWPLYEHFLKFRLAKSFGTCPCFWASMQFLSSYTLIAEFYSTLLEW